MEEKINRIFEEKMTYLKKFSKENGMNMKDMKHELNFAITKLKTDNILQTIEELKKEIKEMNERKIKLTDEINQIKKNLQTLNNVCPDFKPDVKEVNVHNIFSSENFSDHKMIKGYFKEIVHATKIIQEQLKQNEDDDS